MSVNNQTVIENDLVEETPSQSMSDENKPLKRIASLDFLRGLAIFFMIVYHSLMGIYDYSFISDFEMLLEINMAVVVLLGICAYFGTWHGFFLFISSIVNSYAVIKKLSRNESARNLILKQLFSGVVLMAIGFLEQALGYYGVIGKLITVGNCNGCLSYFTWSIFRVDTLQIIGFCLILNALILYLLSIKNGLEKYIRNMIILASMIIVTVVFTFLMREWLPHFKWLYPEGGSIRDIFSVTRANGSFAAWLVSIFFAETMPILPYIATSFAGTMIAMTLLKPKKKRFAPLIGSIIGLLIMVAGVFMIVFGAPWSTIEVNPEVSTYLLRFGGQIILIWAFIYFIDFRGRGDIFANRLFVRFIRRWGVISLTLYCLKIFEFVPRLIMVLLFGRVSGKDFMAHAVYGQGEELGLIFAVVFIVSMYHLLLLLWEKIKFIGTYEWIIGFVQSKLFKVKMKQITDLMDAEKVAWISFKHEVNDPTEILQKPISPTQE